MAGSNILVRSIPVVEIESNRGIAVQPNAMRVLHKLGIVSAVKRAGAIVRRWQFRAQWGEVLCDIELEPLWGDADSFIGIERTKLHDALKSGAVSCRLGAGSHH